MTIWAWFVGTKVGRWIVGIAVALAGLAAALAVAFVKGKHDQADKDKAREAGAAQQALHEAADAAKRSAAAVRQTDEQVSKMPDAGIQHIGDAAADTPAGWLHEHADRDKTSS